MAWVRVETGIASRKVTFRLASWLVSEHELPESYTVPLAVGLLVSLWSAVGENCRDGDVSDVPDRLLEKWAGWEGDSGAFAKWVREHHTSDGRIRDWDETNGPLDTMREGNKRRAQRHREKMRQAGAGQRVKGRNGKPARDVTHDATHDVTHDVTVLRNASTDGRTDGDSSIELPYGSSHPDDVGAPPSTTELAITEPAQAAPTPPALPALRARTKTGILERLALVTEEIRAGSRERLSAEQRRKLSASVVFAYWMARTGANERTLFDSSRELRISSRLRESGDNVHELFYAIDGALRDPWTSGKKDGEKHQSISVLFRSRERVEELASLVHGYKQGIPHPQVAKYAEAIGGEDEAAA